MNPKVNFYFDNEKQWHKEIALMREIALDCGLEEELKWGCPCYTYHGNNIVLIHVFKEYCAYLFFKGSLLQDPEGILVQQTKNVQVPRQVRFTGAKEVAGLKAVLKAYIFEAVEIEKAGIKAVRKETSEFEMPGEFRAKLDKSAALKKAFEALTPGRQRGYLLHFSQAKQARTREARIEKYIPRILEGKGLND